MLKQYLESVIYLEGKKQALAILKNQELVDQLAEIDPTPTNKYIELFAKFIKQGTDISSIQALSDKIKMAEEKKLVIDVTKIKSLEEFQNAITQGAEKITKGSAKKGISGLIEGKDFFYFGAIDDRFGNKYHGYIPLNWKASRVIASDRVGNCEGRWCTSYAKDESYWTEYVKKKKEIFVYLVAEPGAKVRPSYKKLAVEFTSKGKAINVWDSSDRQYEPDDFFK